MHFHELNEAETRRVQQSRINEIRLALRAKHDDSSLLLMKSQPWRWTGEQLRAIELECERIESEGQRPRREQRG